MSPPGFSLTAPATFPPTRYQGSKRKLSAAILGHLRNLDFVTVLDAFGGTGSIAHALKRDGRQVTYNDNLAFNHQIGVALIENDETRLDADDVALVQTAHRDVDYDDFIERTFDGLYYPREENRWLDRVAQNIPRLSCRFRRALAWFAVFQAALIKRPYNLFHRANLSMRTARVDRTFGNKASWDRPFGDYIRRFARQANQAVCDGGGTCRAVCGDAAQVQGEYDLVYIDTPYFNRKRSGTDYLNYYHFLEGMVDYRSWPGRIATRLKHRPLQAPASDWTRPDKVHSAFENLCARFCRSILCVSYRSDGYPGVDELRDLLGRFKSRVRVVSLADYRYALSSNRSASEILLIADS
jgi:adenine-specific DNA methylase